MKHSHIFANRNTGRLIRTLVASLVLAAVLGTSFGLEIPRAQAQLVTAPTDAPTNWLTTIQQTLGTLANVASQGYDAADKNKEFVLDPIAWFAAKFAIQQIQKATVNWINSGFDGSPAFVQDLGGFLQDNADRLAGEFIYGSDLKALCSPFQLNIRIALSLKFLQKESPARCTLSGVVGNVEDFLGGNFAAGGWPGWFEMTVNPNNNFFGASAAAESALLGKLAAKEKVDLNKLLFGKGFLGKEECTPVEEAEDADVEGNTFSRPAKAGEQIEDADIEGNTFMREPKKNCKVVTPGDTISASLNKTLGAGQDALVTADEFNEIILALFQQLAVQVLTGARGLLGTSERGSDGTPSFLDQIGNPQFDTFPGQSTFGNDLILTAIEDEEDYHALYVGIVSKADTILARIKELEALVADEEDDVIWECSSMEGVRARVTAIRTPAFAKQTASEQNLAVLSDLQTRFVTATQNAAFSSTANEERLRVVEAFAALQASGTLHDDIDVEKDRVFVEGLQIAGVTVAQNITGVPKPINTQLAELAAELEGLCRSRPKDGGNGDSDGDGD